MARNKQEDRLSALVRSTERDTWEKGQQAGRWLSQHMYSEKEKREMEKKRRAQQRKAQALSLIHISEPRACRVVKRQMQTGTPLSDKWNLSPACRRIWTRWTA